MIAANELRIGNWISNGDKQFSVDINSLYDIGSAEFNGEDDFPAYPIPLSPEVLEKCGFVNEGMAVDSNWHYRLISIQTNHTNVTYELNLFTTDEKNKYGINLEEQYFGYCSYLHQLQNLYFSLTQTELEFKP